MAKTVVEQRESIGAATAAPLRHRSLYRKDRIYGYLLLLPAAVLYGVLVIGPVAQSFVLSLHAWDGFSHQRTFVGLANYTAVLNSARFWHAFANNIIWSLLSIIPIFVGLVLAVLLYQEKIVGNAFFRVCFLLPFTLSQVITGIIWRWIYHPDWGTVNTVLRALGLDGLTRAWLAEPGTALIAANLVGAWTWFGFCMVIFLAGLQAIPNELYEAARIDGASRTQLFAKITIPLLGTYTRMIAIITVIFSFKVFDLVYVMTRGGPFNSSEVLGLVIYIEGFNHYRIGPASAMAIVLTFIVFVLSAASTLGRQR
jgi:raffinose/stachyose/melibiose transport system permease protein